MIEFRDWLKEEMKDPEFRKEFEELDNEFQLVRALTEARKEAGMTQQQLAEKSGVHIR